MAGIPVNRGGWHTHVYVEVIGIPVDRCGWHTLGQRWLAYPWVEVAGILVCRSG